jgi:hypothetical protein
MPTTSARATPKPNKQKGRTVAVRPLQKLHNISASTDTASALRLQRLAALGVGGSSAALLASLIWGTDGAGSLIGGAL